MSRAEGRGRPSTNTVRSVTGTGDPMVGTQCEGSVALQALPTGLPDPGSFKMGSLRPLAHVGPSQTRMTRRYPQTHQSPCLGLHFELNRGTCSLTGTTISGLMTDLTPHLPGRSLRERGGPLGRW